MSLLATLNEDEELPRYCGERIPSWDCECRRPPDTEHQHICWRCGEWRSDRAR